MILKNILQSSHYSLDLFAKDSIDKLESRIKVRQTGGGE